MKKRFTAGTMAVVALALLISAVAGSFSLYLRQKAAAARELREQLLLVEARWWDGVSPEELAQGFRQAAPDKRLTVIGPDGAVLADTGGAEENHTRRPEVLSARTGVWGEATRRSDTLGVPMLYAAKSPDGQTVLRAAMPLSSVEALIWDSVPSLITAALVALAAAFALARPMARYLVRPLGAVSRAIREALSGRESGELEQYDSDDELRPILRDIRQLVSRLRESLDQVKAERAKMDLVLDCMDEGLLLLDENGDVLAVNRAARELFGLPQKGAGGAQVLLRSKRLGEALTAVRRDKAPAVVDVSDPALGERELRFFLSPVTDRQYEGKSVGTAVLVSDVTELKKAENVRSEFTANVSHELKTPLTSIKGFSEMLSAGMVKNEADQKRFLTLIGVEADRLISLINDILELSELESAAIDRPDEAASPLDAAHEVEKLLSDQAQAKNIVISVSGDKSPARISPDRLKELLLNLMENAVKYGKEGGGVEVKTARSGERVTITVSDDGIGIPDEAQSHIFERFYRVDKGRPRQSGGTGLGLAIVKHIAELYGGAVTVESELGRGSAFTVILPAAE